ncbi:HIRA protein, putative [Pediculus humanus corporis]|uniref:Protein HIRA n=1 Tax=Pediculus humanus subsp. corporis TaxID=121224 RepID=E0VUV4_PEDHC|nr:HIRA protein, putative [Pediculus humanus corporis]EEB17160.1 HIRA protein, putative [Pediculus humanus corporis]
MRLTKPGWVNHDGKPIFSLDIHPDGSRFATGGQGKDSGRVTIWNLGPVIYQEYEKNENVPKLLCQLDNHLSCVNCVRWNHSGKFLASGGDDKLIMIWKKTGQTKLDENKVIVGVEIWRCVGTLTGHSNDVLDLAWAPHDSCLASCSVDNTIIVWNMEKIPDIVAKLTGHTGLVKGVTWDPVGQYLASQSDDKSLRIWRTKDWKQQACITEPFKECGDMTHVLRLNWSPDGQYLVSAHASNSGGPTAQIIEIIERPIDVKKKSWSCEMDFVGHRKAVTCIRFNSNLLQKKPAGEGSKQTKYCALATGSRDCALAVWCTAKKRPIVVINNIFLKSVLDLSWSKDGMQLVACSWDGSIAHLMFKQEELGIIVSEQEKLTTLESMYGKSFATKHLNQTKITPIIETPELLEFVPPSLSLPNTAKTNQPPSGKKQDPVEIENSKQSSISDVLLRSKQIETRTADGKRRVTPITVPRDLAEFKTKIIIEQRPEVVTPNVSPEKQKQQSTGIVSVPNPSIAHSTPFENHDVPSKNSGISAKVLKRPTLLPADVSSKKIGSSEQLTQQSFTKCTNCEIYWNHGCDSIIEVENSKSLERPCRMRRLKKVGPDKEIEWEFVYGQPISCVKSNNSITVLACMDCTLHVISTDTGKSKALPIKLPGLLSCIALTKNNLVCAVTSRGYLFVWDFNVHKLLLQNFTLRHTLLCESDELSSISSCEVTEDGIPLITLSCGKCYCYNNDLGWLLLSDTTSVLWKVSHQDVLVRNATTLADTKLPLKSIQSQIKGSTSLVNSRVPLVKNLPVQLCTAAFLQQQMNAAISIVQNVVCQRLYVEFNEQLNSISNSMET